MADTRIRQGNPIVLFIIFITAFLILIIGFMGTVLYVSVFVFYVFKRIKIPCIEIKKLQLSDEEIAATKAIQQEFSDIKNQITEDIRQFNQAIREPQDMLNRFSRQISFITSLKKIDRNSLPELLDIRSKASQLNFANTDIAYLDLLFSHIEIMTSSLNKIDETIATYRTSNGSFNKNGSISLKSNKGKQTKNNIDALKASFDDELSRFRRNIDEFICELKSNQQPFIEEKVQIKNKISEKEDLLRVSLQKEKLLINGIYESLTQRKEKALDEISAFLDEYRFKASTLVSFFAFVGSIVIALDSFKTEMNELSSFVTNILSISVTFLPSPFIGVTFVTSVITWGFFYLFFTFLSDKSALMKLEKKSPELFQFIVSESADVK
ncbi:hypothetical protein ISG33_08615 [Glaciecola sp. MH2013]|uniref:hypothetical protein n=1 Tax=Glaciecola sp. MH2013 TaxID=2785524 RepID=UPI0018A0DF2F|nr:hypothetical protein [Glaciecola sp. MH2013]MBF7073455.1 hypothetical protein [Glaciecola sp. MH2013]